jgi:hypothetical protein
MKNWRPVKFFVAVLGVAMVGALSGCPGGSATSKGTPDANTLVHIRVPGASPVTLFQGYDSITGEGLSTAVQGSQSATGGTSTATITICTDLSSLTSALSVDQSFTAGLPGFGGFDERVKFVQDIQFTETSIAIVVSARHVQKTLTATNVTLSPFGGGPSSSQAAATFFHSYGDSYVSSITLGGEYDAVYTFYSASRTEQSNLEARLAANGLVNGVSLNGSLNVSLATFIQHETTRSGFSQQISGIQNPQLPASDKVADFALGFSSIPLDAPTVISFQTTGYERVPRFGNAFGTVVANRALFLGGVGATGLSDTLMRVLEVQNKIAEIQGVYKSYGGFDDPALLSVQTETQNDVGAIANAVNAFERNPIAMLASPVISSTVKGSPRLNFTLGSSPSHGGTGGDPFDDLSASGLQPETYLSRHTHIRSVQINAGTYIDHLTVSYSDDGGRAQSFQHGGSGGSAYPALQLGDTESFTAINGSSGTYVDHLTLPTTASQVADGGGGGGTPFSNNLGRPIIPIAFAGRAHDYLDQIFVRYAEFLPATWER